MLQMVKKQPFDLVDAINWLVMRKNLKGNKLLEHSLDIVKSSSIDKYANIFSKMINVIITSTSFIIQKSTIWSGLSCGNTKFSFSSCATSTKNQETAYPNRSQTATYFFLNPEIVFPPAPSSGLRPGPHSPQGHL